MNDSTTPGDSNILLLPLAAMIRAYSKIDPSRADDLQLLWWAALGDATGKSERDVIRALCNPQEPLFQAVTDMNWKIDSFARSCEKEGTRGHQLAMEAWTLDRITSAAEKAVFPIAIPLWALVEELNDGEIPPPPEGLDPFAGVIDEAVVDATTSLLDRLVRICDLVQAVAELCTTEELNQFPFLVPLVDLMNEVAQMTEGSERPEVGE